MSSTKNTIILGCFILAGFAMHAYLTRFEPVTTDFDRPSKRFNKMTGEYDFYKGIGFTTSKRGWSPSTGKEP